MANLPSVDVAYQMLVEAASSPSHGTIAWVESKAAVLNAAVSLETARTLANTQSAMTQTMDKSSDALRASVDRFTEASNAGTAELAKWNRSTARWTMALTLATWALFGAMVVQIVVMILRRSA